MRANIVIPIFVAIAVLVLNVYGQGKPVKWEPLNGQNNEFTVFMPEGSLAIIDKGIPGFKMRLINARRFNDVVLLLTYYEGNAKRIQDGFGKSLIDKLKFISEKNEVIKGFEVDRFIKTTAKLSHRVEHFLKDDRLYVLESYAPAGNNRIVNAFFESVRLRDPDGIVGPNAPAGATKTSLPGLVEHDLPVADESVVVALNEVDREPIVLRHPSLSGITPDMRQGLTSGEVKIRILMSSSGKVTKTEVVKRFSPLINREFAEALKKTIFIPAVKDGKLVSVYQESALKFGGGGIDVIGPVRSIF